MPKLHSKELAICFDMGGCPNRCKHCWIGYIHCSKTEINEVKGIVNEFRNYKLEGESSPYFENIVVNTWFREPDYLPNYKELYELEKELGDEAKRFELMSIWRIARDTEYPKWIKSIGIEKCQITFFGLEENTDFFTGRKGAFKDNLIATERLLEAGIMPRWQLFLSEKNKLELNEFVNLIEERDLEERVKNLGKEFEVYVYVPSPDGEAFNIENLRPTSDIIELIPKYLVDKTMKYFNITDIKEVLGYEENEILPKLLECSNSFDEYPDIFALMITSNLDVYSNAGELKPWWCLGNIKTDGIDTIMNNYINNVPLGLKLVYDTKVADLANKYGNREGKCLYSEEALIRRYIRISGERNNR